MRVTTGMYYNNMFVNNNRVNKELFDVNKQISSGLKIQYAFEDTDTFVKTMKLDNEVTTFTQIKSSVESGLKFSQQTDSTIGEFTKTLDAFKVKLVQAASDVHSDASLEAIAQELKGIRNNMLSLANTSINGQYLFAGTALNEKPINADGSYNGNDISMSSLLGNDLFQVYNITGQELFFGEESQTQRMISTNVTHMNMTELYPDIMKQTDTSRALGSELYITGANTIRDLVGDVHTQVSIDNGTEVYATTHFYLSGTQHDGTAFRQKIAMTGDENVSTLMEKIGEAYGNTPTNRVVDVTINPHGQFEITDRLSGSSKLDFHMVAATDFTARDDDTSGTIDPSEDAADVTDINDLDLNGSTDLDTILANYNPADPTNPVDPAQPYVLITEFVKSDFSTEATGIGSISYDRVGFETQAATVTSNVSQIVKSDNSFAVASTKLLDVASGTTLDGVTMDLGGTDIAGNAFSATINLSNAGSSFTVGGNTYTIYNTGVDPKQPISAANPQTAVAADEMTYQQLMDVINMVTTGTMPATTASIDAQGVATDYRTAIQTANTLGQTQLSSDGRIAFEEIGATSTLASLSLYDATAGDFTDTNAADDPNVDATSALTFMTNNALTIRDPKTDFFARIDEMIAAVEQQKMRADSETGEPRNGGIQNGIQMLDDLLDHISRKQAKSGVNSQALSATRDRTEMLILSAQTLRSEVIDTDVAEASLRLQQLSLNMQAIYSSTAKISQLSLVNYL